MSGVICDEREVAKVKGKFYNRVVRPKMIHLGRVALTKRLETVGGGRFKDDEILLGSDKNCQD